MDREEMTVPQAGQTPKRRASLAAEDEIRSLLIRLLDLLAALVVQQLQESD
jgi:hypothetical protein